MNEMSFPNALRRVLLAAALALVAPLAIAQPANAEKKDEAAKPTITKEVKETVLGKVTEIVTTSAYVPGVDFAKWNEFIAGEQEGIEKAANEREFTNAVNAALKKFGFSHIVLTTPEAARARVTRQTVGVGVQLQPEDEGLRVVAVFPEAPAAKAGVEVGDLVILANGKKPGNPAELAGEEGSILELKVKKSDGKIKDYKLTRSKYSNIRPETLTWVNPNTAMLKVPTFDVGYNRKRVEELMTEASKGKNLILDLRSNPGGAVINLTHLMGLLLPEGTPLGTFISRSTVNRFVKERGGDPTDLVAIANWSPMKLKAQKSSVAPFKGNIAVLINGGSGSASEIAAAALKESLNAPVVGTKSAGAVLVSVMAPMPHGFMLQYPITDYVTMQGLRLEGNGVLPVMEAPAMVRFGEPDLAVDKAVTLLQRAELRNNRDGR